MAKTVEYLVSFNPATKTSHGFMVAFDMTTRSKVHRVTASSLPQLEQEVRRLAADDYGQTCSAYVRLADRNGRKPAGFDAWNKGFNIIEVTPVPDAVAAAMDSEPGDLPDAVAAAWGEDL